jgi:hypothetical protein
LSEILTTDMKARSEPLRGCSIPMPCKGDDAAIGEDTGIRI